MESHDEWRVEAAGPGFRTIGAFVRETMGCKVGKMKGRRGHTLVELLVAISLMTIVVGIACGIWVSSVREGVARALEYDFLLGSWLQERRNWEFEPPRGAALLAGDSSLFVPAAMRDE